MEYRQGPPRGHQPGPMSTPTGEKTLAAMSVPLDHLAANLDPGYERVGQRHRAALLAPPPERLVQLPRVDAMQSDQLIGDDDRIAVDDWRGR